MTNYYRSPELYVTGGCRKLHKEDLNDLLSSPSIIRRTDKRELNVQDMYKSEKRKSCKNGRHFYTIEVIGS
jgi:hypothetical protein